MMSAPGVPPATFHIRTFGCQMNEHDSGHIRGVMTAAGYTCIDSAEDADILIFNTCCVRQGAEDRVWGNLGMLAGLTGGPRVVAVCGCMAQKHGVEILRRSGVVTLVFGLDSLERLPELIEASVSGTDLRPGRHRESLHRWPAAAQRGISSAWVPVSHGCDNRCTYCVVPSVRGRLRSRPPLEVLDEVSGLARLGVVEVTLLGQNVNAYGRDLETHADFAGLLRSAAEVPGIRRVKFETSHPGDMHDEVLEVMAAGEQCLRLPAPAVPIRLKQRARGRWDAATTGNT